MKKIQRILCVLIGVVGLAPGLCGADPSFHFEAGVLYGPRLVADPDIRNIYGNGLVYLPYAAISWRGIAVGGSYEGGYSRRAEVGIYKEPSSLEINGVEVFVGYSFKIKKLIPYAKMGFGSYSYRQKIDSPYLAGFRVDHKKTTLMVGGGIKIHALKSLFLVGEAKYVPLKVKPFEEEVDLSGLRLLAGIGFGL